MKTYIIDYYSNKAIRLIKDIIRTEDLDATVNFANDAYDNEIIEVVCDEEDYQTLRSIYYMIK